MPTESPFQSSCTLVTTFGRLSSVKNRSHLSSVQGGYHPPPKVERAVHLFNSKFSYISGMNFPRSAQLLCTLGSLSQCRILALNIQLLQQGQSPQLCLTRLAVPAARHRAHQARKNLQRTEPPFCLESVSPIRKTHWSATNFFGFFLGLVSCIWQPRQQIRQLCKILRQVCTSNRAVAVNYARPKSRSLAKVPGSACTQHVTNSDRRSAYSKTSFFLMHLVVLVTRGVTQKLTCGCLELLPFAPSL